MSDSSMGATEPPRFDAAGGRQNPFSAHRIQPSAVAFLFPPGTSADALVERLHAALWRGQIVGPHGSGKSTLLAALLSALQRAGHSTLSIALRDGQRKLPREFLAAARRSSPDLLAIDGYEQLGLWRRFMLGRLCRRRGLGLVVTSHRSAGLPDLFRTAVDARLAWRVVEQLQAGFPPLVTFDDVAERLARHPGDLRETLFDLYDLYTQRRDGAGPLSRRERAG
jgi:hypothetical protein